MPSREHTSIRVGIFVFVGVFLAMVIIFLLGSEKQIFKTQYNLTTEFKDISGLRVGAPVQLAGVTVGLVDGIQFGEALEDKKVHIKLAINTEFQDRIRKDSRAEIATQGLLGDKFIIISVGSTDQEILQDGAAIESMERPSFASVIQKSDELVATATKVAKSLADILQELETGKGLVHSMIYETKERPMGQNVSDLTKEAKEAAAELRQILEKINKGEGTIGAFVTDPSLYYDLRRIFARVERNKLLTHIIRSRVRDLELEKVDQGKSQNQ